METTVLSKQRFDVSNPGQPEPISPATMVKLDVVLRGSGAIDGMVTLQVSDTPDDEASWEETSIQIVTSGTDEVMASDFAYVTKRHYRVWPYQMNCMSVYAVVSKIEESDHPDRVVALDAASFVQKSKVFKLPSRKPVTLDVHISGTVTIRLYASNVETRADGTKWGSPLREFTTSTKVVIENEPWVNWMVEYSSGTGIASVAAGA